MEIAGVFVAYSVKYLIITYLFFAGFYANAQDYLNDTMSVSPTGTYLQSLYEVDSGYYWVGMTPHPNEPGNPNQFVFGFTHYNGDFEVKLMEYDTLQDQRVGFSNNSLVLNNNGNFVHAYTNCGSGNCYPRVKEVSPQGNVVRDTILRDIIDSLGLLQYDYTNFYYEPGQDQYLLFANCTDTARFNAGLPASGTQLYLRLTNQFEIIDTIHFKDPILAHSYVQASSCDKFNGDKIVMIQTNKQAGSQQNEEARVDFYKIESNGNYSKVAEYDDGGRNIPSFSLINTIDSSYVFVYIDGDWDNLNDEWLYTNRMCKLDSNYSLLWEVPLYYQSYPTQVIEVFPNRVIETTDSCYAVAVGGGSGGNSNNGAILMKFNSGGEMIWQRIINKTFPSIQDTSYSDVEIRDLIENNSGGFTLFGRHDNNPLVSSVEKKIYGYIVETNCLGFMAPPEAHVDYQIEDNFNVFFFNNSMQSGSYTWDFGDGTILNTDEYMDTVSHTYSGFGEFTVTLIAKGCDGENDTLSFIVEPSLHSDPTVITDGQGYFTLFPNPSDAHGALYIYLNGLNTTASEITLDFITEDGRKIDEIKLNNSEGTYILNPNLSAGIYLVSLVKDESIIQTRRLLVK